MPLRTLSALLFILLLSTAPSEARRRAGSGRVGLSSERGLSQAESQAAGVVLAETASGASATNAAPELPARRYSPDYYRVYHQRVQAAAVKKVPVSTPAPKPAPSRPQPKAPAPTPAPKITRVAAPTPKPVPPAPPARPVVKRVAVAAPKPTPKPTPAPKPVARRVAVPPPQLATPKLTTGQRPPIRTAVMPADSAGTIYLPVNRKAAPTPAPARPAAASGVAPKRAVFR